MPDPNKLASFLQRTQKAMQDAVTRGSQAEVDQYENFLDRGNALGERLLGAQGPQGGAGQQGAAGSNLPSPPQDQSQGPPQLMDSGAQKGPTDMRGKLVTDPVASLSDNRDQETNPFTLAGVGKPQSSLQQLTNGIPKAPVTSYAGTNSSSPSAATPPPSGGNSMGLRGLLPSAGDWSLPKVDTSKLGLSGMLPGMGSQSSTAAPWTTPGWPGTGDVRKATAPSAAYGSEENPIQGSGGPGQEQYGDPETKVSLDDVLKNTQNNPDIQAELLKLKNSLGDKPQFFTLENLAMLLLMGAPKAYSHFKGELGDWQKNNMAIDQLGLQYKVGKAGDASKMAHWAQQSKDANAATAATLLPHIVSSKQAPMKDEMNDIAGEMRTIINSNPGFQYKAGDPITTRLEALKKRYDELAAGSAGVADNAYKQGK